MAPVCPSCGAPMADHGKPDLDIVIAGGKPPVSDSKDPIAQSLPPMAAPDKPEATSPKMGAIDAAALDQIMQIIQASQAAKLPVKKQEDDPIGV